MYLSLLTFQYSSSGSESVKAAILAASSHIACPTAHTRLIVVTGISKQLSLQTVETTLRRVCNKHGGLYKDMLYIPSQQVRH